MEVRERKNANHNNPPQESSSISSYAPLNSSNTARNETPDQNLVHLHRRNSYINHGLQEQEQQIEACRERRESNPDPDPVSQTPPPPSLPPLPPPDNAAVSVVVRYRECLKNHAASMGSHALDGCGEFMPNGEEGTPGSLKCAACDCHRSFHRREVDGEPQPTTRNIPITHNPPPHRATTMQPPHHHRHNHHVPPFMVAFGAAGNSIAQTESSSEDLDMFRTYSGQPSKKRFRTKFTEEQKEKMHEFAEKIGWKIQKQDEKEILQLCNEVGVKRKVFKVWMHNCKQASKKKQEEL